MMKRLLLLSVVALAAAGCGLLPKRNADPYANPFWGKYLDTGSKLDTEIKRTLEAVRANPDSAPLHNQLGAQLVEKGFPKDAEREFERAVDIDSNFYPAWYNLGLVRGSRGDARGAKSAFARTVREKPGHANALFQLGMIEEKSGHETDAVEHYAKAYSINRALLDVRVNPRVVDSKLTHLALIKLYDRDHQKLTMQFHGTPTNYSNPDAAQAASPQPGSKDIVTPTAPLTDPARQPAPPTPSPRP